MKISDNKRRFDVILTYFNFSVLMFLESGHLPQQVTSYRNHGFDDSGCYGATVGFERKLHRWVYGRKCKKIKDKMTSRN